jgi:cation diffusion facilitator CzcD-associated flavoprotein CzcO
MSQHHSILIVGGGSGGLSVAARLRNLPNPPEVTVIEPSDYHYYQPLWTLVGAGVLDKEAQESFPFDQSQERYGMYLLKVHALPELYWNGMLRGRA